MKINMVDLVRQYADIKDTFDKEVLEILASGGYVGGPKLKNFEEKCQKYIGVKHAIGCANGTDALQISMMALGISEGDEVITTPFTFIATAEMIALVGAKPVFVDIDEKTYNIDPEKLEAAITDKTKAIIPVHLYGQAADMDRINEIAKKHNLYVIEDNAQAFGAEYKGKKVGQMSDFATVSFYPAKNLGAAGDGGLIMTNDDELAAKARNVANHGQSVRYKHARIGVNSRLDSIQAAFLAAKLEHLDRWNARRNEIACKYNEKFAQMGAITPFVAEGNNHIYHQYTLRVNNRDGLQKHLADNGIPSAVHYPIPLHMQEAFAYLNVGKGSLPVAEKVSEDVISLPIHPHMTDEEVDFVIEKIGEFIK